MEKRVKIYCLTLEGSKRHLKRKKNFDEIGLPYEFVWGVYLSDMKDVPEDFYKDKAVFKHSMFSNNDTFIPRTYACALGQVKLIKTFLEDETADFGFILEDDVYFNKGLVGCLDYVCDMCNSNTLNGIIDLGTDFCRKIHSKNTRNLEKAETALNPVVEIVSSSVTRSTMGKLINKEGAEKLLKIYERLYAPCDIQFQRAGITCGLGVDFGIIEDTDDRYNSVIGYGLNNLVFDVGANRGQYTDYFLKNGFYVISVDGSPYEIKGLYDKYKNNDRCRIVCSVVSDKEEDIDFYISNINSEFNSCNKGVVMRYNNYNFKTIKVKTRTLQDLFDTYGVPYYCKIDIEGNDEKAIRSMIQLPKYISAEVECPTKQEDFSKRYDVLNALYEKGYRKFKVLIHEGHDGNIAVDSNMTEKFVKNPIFPWEIDIQYYDYETAKTVIEYLGEKYTKNDYGIGADIYAEL